MTPADAVTPVEAPAKAPASPPAEVRFPLTAEDLTTVLWLIEGVWATGNVQSSQQAAYLVGLTVRVQGVLAQAKPPQKGPQGAPKAP